MHNYFHPYLTVARLRRDLAKRRFPRDFLAARLIFGRDLGRRRFPE